jgi:hypothetical protein
VPVRTEDWQNAGVDADLVALVDRRVVPLVEWYQCKKRWPRRLYRATTTMVILLGASIPLLALGEPSEATRLLASVVGVTISGLTGLAAVYDWQRRWRIFTGAQTALEGRLAEWELAFAEAGQTVPPERTREIRIAATRDLVTAAAAIRQGETEDFFAGQPSTVSRPTQA